MIWPEGKKFAFTIIDDTDNSYVQNIKPVYDLLIDLNIRSTKTVWVYPPRDQFQGDCLQNEAYRKFILDLIDKGFEIGMHNVGSGSFKRQEILEGIELFKEYLGFYPDMHINHSRNPDNLYWGYKRFVNPLKGLMKQVKSRRVFEGEDESSPHFWGDAAKKHIQYMRNHVFNRINTLDADPYMPYRSRAKDKYSNYWFSSSDGHTIEEFNSLLSPDNVALLEKDGGCCIIYTHFASGFVDEDGNLNETFKQQMTHLSEQNGWFVPASKILDHLKAREGHSEYIGASRLRKLDRRWMNERVVKKFRFGR